MALPALISTSGRLAPLPFALGALAVYLLGFGSQTLLAPPVTARAGLWPFVFLQAVLVWGWVVLHVRRLRDAGCPSGLTGGIAAVYALEIVLIVIIVALILNAGFDRPEGGGQEPGLLQFFLLLYLIALLTGGAAFGSLSYWIMGFALVMLLPILIGLCFSIWATTRPRVPPAP